MTLFSKRILLLAAIALCMDGLGRSRGELSGGYYSDTAEPWQFQTWGSFKSIAAYQQLRHQQIFANNSSALTEQRLRIGGAITKDWFRFEFANEVSITAQPPNPSVVPLPNLNPTQAFDATAELYTSDSILAVSRLDRAFAQMTFGDTEFRIGRQVIPMGVGKIYSAISQVPRQPFVIVDSEFPVTEDAIAFDYNGPLLFQARFLPKVPGQRDHNFHLRVGERNINYDLVLTAGRSDDKLFVGFESAKNLFGFVFRGEVIGYEYENEPVMQAMVGIDRVISQELSAMVEFFYNGFGTANPAEYNIIEQTHRSSPYKGQLYAGTKLSAQLSPLFNAHLGASMNVNDASTLFHLYFDYSLSDDLEVLFGQYLNVSPNPLSEYGGSIPLGFGYETGLPDLTYFVLKYHF